MGGSEPGCGLLVGRGEGRILGEWLNIACFPKDEVAIHNMKSVDISRYRKAYFRQISLSRSFKDSAKFFLAKESCL
jgi:hypothetical protein